MKAMIFAAGLGTRLRPLTDTLPKALVPISGKPLLQHTIEKLKRAGFDEIIINIHHFGQQIIDFVAENQSFGIRIEFSDERDKLLDTGGGIKKAAWFFNDGEPFLVHNVDILSNIDLRELLAFQKGSSSVATLVCSKRQTSRYLLFEGSGHLRGWINKKTGETKPPYPHINPSDYQELAFSGIHILQPAILDRMQEWPDAFSVIDFYIGICHENIISSYTPSGLQTIDAGKPETLSGAERFFRQLR
ncbi:MAG: nucleotidyltransferase family protein [Proteiniphilum sp.]|jgi:NDP-sugar pyrophosphorylase family protein|nr:nucleotidyltransferase family protein [Proteiniphilum sp.]MDD3968100.1 nucleotidyltransferase family protein [Proteiniphilum sp.]MDD4459458.1 nucleotidyltransferase family protein [Proteiniphilum sp.]